MSAPKREPCGCELVESTTRYGHEIAYCPEHAAGPQAVELLRDVLDEYTDTFDASCEPGHGWAGSGRIRMSAGEDIRALLRTLAPADDGEGE